MARTIIFVKVADFFFDAVYKNVHLTGIPALDSMPSHQMPWMRTPKPGLPKLIDETAIGPLSDFIAACTLTSGVFTNDLKGKTEFNRCAEESSNLKLDAENETKFSTFRALFKTYCTNKNIDVDEDWLTYSYLSRFNIQRYVSLKDGSDSVTGFKKVVPWSIRQVRVRLQLTNSKVGVSLSLLEPYQTEPLNTNRFSIRGTC